MAAECVPADLRHRAGQRGDAERGAPVHRRARRRPRAARRHDRADPLAHGRVVARSARDALPRALPSARTHRGARERRARGRRTSRSPSAPPWCERSRPSSTIAASCTPAPAGPSSSSRPNAGVQAVDGLLTGWHEPEATHLLMLEAIAGRPTLERAYDEATARWIPVARVRRQPPAAARIDGDIRRMSDSTLADAARRTPRGAVRACGDAARPRPSDIARQLDMTRERRPPAPRPRSSTTASPRRPSCRARGPARPAPARVHGHRQGRRPVPEGLRRAHQRAARAMSPTPTPALVDTLFERRRDERVRNATERLAKRRSLKAKVAELAAHPRRRRVPRDVGRDPRRLPHHRAQLRDLGGRAALRAGVHERDRLHPHGAARRERRAGAAHGRRRTPLRVRGAPVTLKP